MRRNTVSLMLLAAVLLGIVGFALAAEFPVSKMPAGKRYPAVSGKKVVWLSAAPSIQAAQFFCVDLKAKPNQPPQVIPIPSMYSGVVPGEPPPSISGNTIVWSVGSNLYKYDLVSRQTALVTSSPGRIRWPVVDGHIVVWQDTRRGENNGDIYGYDLSSGTRGAPFRICTTSNNQEKPVVAGDVVAWTEKEMDPNDAAKFTCSVYYSRLSIPGSATLIHTVPQSSCAVILGISGETVVWGEKNNVRGCQEDIYSYHIKTQKKLPICTGPWLRQTGWHYGVSGKIVVWADWRNSTNPLAAPPSDLYAYDLTTGQEFPITSNSTSAKCCPGVSGNTAVWMDWRSEPAGVMKGDWNTTIYGESFKVPAHTIVVGKGRAKPGDSGLLSVSLKGGTGVYAFPFDLNYDAAMLDIPSSVSPGATLANWNFAWKDLGNGKLHIEAHSLAGPLTADGEVARVKFGVKDTVMLGAQCTVWASGIKLKDQYLQDIRPVGDVIGKISALPLVDHFAVTVIPGEPEPQGADPLLPFGLLVEARDEEDQLATRYAGSATLTSNAGNCSPHNLNFANGVWNGSLAISHDQPASATLTVSDATMPASGTSSSFDLRARGDVDGTGNVDFLDVLCAANLAIGKYVGNPPRFIFKAWAADANRDHAVNVLDVISIINMCLGRTPSPSPPQAPITVSLVNLGNGVRGVKVSNATGLAGVQFEITPANATLSKGPLASGWALNRNIVNGKQQVIAYSPNAAGISASSGVLLRLGGITGAPTITNKVFSDANGNAMPAFP